jgi:hypothetical protein
MHVISLKSLKLEFSLLASARDGAAPSVPGGRLNGHRHHHKKHEAVV